jgi:predicted MPP superfamily phosphohydrolase
MRKARIAEITNTGYWFMLHGKRLRVAGVDDLWEGTQDLNSALFDARTDDACILLSHNPDYVETLADARVGLVLSGHTHGGQVVLPGPYAPFIPSKYGTKYLHGLVKTDFTQVYVSRGLATVGPPIRIGAPPEISLLTLVPAT